MNTGVRRLKTAVESPVLESKLHEAKHAEEGITVSSQRAEEELRVITPSF